MIIHRKGEGACNVVTATKSTATDASRLQRGNVLVS